MFYGKKKLKKKKTLEWCFNKVRKDLKKDKRLNAAVLFFKFWGKTKGKEKAQQRDREEEKKQGNHEPALRK